MLVCVVVSEYKCKIGEELLQIYVLADKADVGGLSLFCTSLHALPLAICLGSFRFLSGL